MTLDSLLNLFGKEKNKIRGNRARSLIKKKIRNQINKLEAKPFDIQSQKITEVLHNSDIVRLRRKLGAILSMEGKAALVILPFKNTYIVDVIKVSDYVAIGKMEQRVTGFSGAVYIHDGVDYPIFSEYSYNEEGQPILRRYIEIEDEGQFVIQEDVVFNGLAFLPVEVFFNNEDRLGDVAYAEVEDDLVRLDYFDQKLKAEWERTRTLIQYNTNFTDNDPKQHTEEIDNGKGYIEEDSFNAKLGNGTNVIPAGAGTTVLQQQILFLEDDIKNKLGIRRDTTGSNNRHNLEVVIDEQEALETLMAEKTMRESHWNQFVNKLGALLGEAEETIEIEISDIEQAKLDLLAAQVAEAQMKSQNVASQLTTQEQGE